MKITKFGHACILVEEGEARILIDPGSYSVGQNDLENVDAVLVTHEHSDHVDLNSLQSIISKNPNVRIITNEHVRDDIEIEKITAEAVKSGDFLTIHGIGIEVVGEWHAYMHKSVQRCMNIGFIVGGRLLHPGDSLVDIDKKIDILALPVAGPWLKLSEAIDYALEIKPKVCFPVHDGILKKIGSTNEIPPKVLGAVGIKFEILEIGKEHNF